jgi:hypothetical protein
MDFLVWAPDFTAQADADIDSLGFEVNHVVTGDKISLENGGAANEKERPQRLYRPKISEQGFHALTLEIFDASKTCRNFPEKGDFWACRPTSITENRGWQAAAGHLPSILFGKVGPDCLLNSLPSRWGA